MSLSPTQKKNRSIRQANRNVNVLRATKNVFSKELILPCVDVEAFEFAQDQVLEIGVSYIDVKQLSVTHTDHYIISQYRNRRNGKYVCDNKDNFDFGESKIVRMQEVSRDLSNTFKRMGAISAFGTKSDCKHLINSNIHVPSKRVDVNTLYETCYQFDKHRQISLKRLCEQFGHTLDHPHNAGNDAHVTALCLVDILKHIRDTYDTLLQKSLKKLENLHEPIYRECILE